jgi:peptidylprolyl isomerase
VFPTPLVVKKPEVSVVKVGDGDLISDGQQVDVSLSIYYGKTGEDLAGHVQSGRIAAGLDKQAISEALVCAHVGDRLALVTTTAEAYGKGAGAGGNLADDDTLVMVIDVTAAYLGKADGFNQLPQDGMPVVVTAVDGTPAIAVNFVSKPKTNRIETVKAGTGAKIRKDDTVVIQLRAWVWPTDGDDPAEILQANSNGQPSPLSTWGAHQAAAVTLGADSILPPGVSKGVVGAKVGSQLLVVVPPGKDHYATVPSSLAGLTADDTMIWVVDILGIQKDSDK